MAGEASDLEAGGDAPPKKKGKLRLILFILVPLLLLGGTGAGLYFTGTLDAILGKKKEAKDAKEAQVEAPPPKESAFFPLDDKDGMLVNLNSPGRKTNFLKIKITLQMDNKADEAVLKNLRPRILDTFQSYMRELRLEDLKGSAGLYRLREELLLRVNLAAAPVKIDDVLFEEMLVQ